MKKVLSVLTALTLALGMAACSSNDNSAGNSVADVTALDSGNMGDSSVPQPDTESMWQNTNEDNITEEYLDIDLEVIRADGSVTSAKHAEPQNLNDGINMTVYASASLDSPKYMENLYADIYVFCDGRIIKHSVNADEEPTDKTRHTIEPLQSNTIPIYIPPTSIGNVDKTRLWVYINYLPDYIPVDGFGEIDLGIMYSIPVTSEGENNATSIYEAQESDYIYNKMPKEFVGYTCANIGTYKEKNFTTAKDFMDDLSVINDDTDFAVTAYSKAECDHYLAVFRNGELINAFDGNTFMKAGFNGGERMMKYSIDKSALPANGVYAYQVIAMPTKLDDDSNDSVSAKRHTTIALGD